MTITINTVLQLFQIHYKKKKKKKKRHPSNRGMLHHNALKTLTIQFQDLTLHLVMGNELEVVVVGVQGSPEVAWGFLIRD